MEVNGNVVNGFQDFGMGPFQTAVAPKYASIACLSVAMQALWTNRVPMHEPWPRVMKVDQTANVKTDDYKKNVHHNDQYDNSTSPAGLKPIGRVEGDDDIGRGELWRR